MPYNESFIKFATQAQLESYSGVTGVAIDPSGLINHPGIPKAVGIYTSSGGTHTLQWGYGISSLTDHGVGDLTINWTTAFSSANYAVQLTCSRSTVPGGVTINQNPTSAPTTTAFRLIMYSESSSFLNGPIDCTWWSVTAWGDQ